ncbi:MAG: metallophosphoesterase [Butyricicoccus sp.]|nr:metallophosphoesterase [Butyricicoccus sp.]
MQWKQKISGVLAAAMVAGSLPAALAWEAPDVATWAQASREGVKARFFVGSDTHIGRSGAQEKVANALNVFYQVDPQADGVLLVGDLTDNGAEAQYDTLMSTINNSPMAGKVYMSMGNHDHYSGGTSRFEEKTGQKASEVLDFNGVTVVKLNPSINGNNYTNDYDLLKGALEDANTADPTAPVIIIGHHGVKNTAYVTNEWYGSYGEGTDKDMVALMEQYPQAIHISGHSHSTLEDARSIYQDDGFTAIQDSTIGAYFENESGKVDPTTGKGSTYPDDPNYSSQALRIDVLNDNTVKIYRMDLTEGAYMYEDEPWTFSSADLPYTNDRAASSKAPSFAEGAAVTVENVTGDSMIIKFPAAAEASGANVDMIHEYQITLTDSEGSQTVRKVFADYYKEPRKTDWAVKVADLTGETTYSVAVTAVTSFGAASEPITAAEDVTTGAGYKPVYPAEAILDVDFSRDATGADAKGHTLNVYGEPQFVKDAATGRTVASFDGVDDGLRYSMTDEDYEKLTKNFTVELYYMPKDTVNNNPMGNTQSAGFCFEQKSGTNTLQFWAHIGGSYKKPEAAVTANAWNHIVGTYDGENVKMYVNGELRSTVAATGSLSEPPHYLFLGGDTSTEGTLEYQANCEIALARVYTGTMTADDVKVAYEAASAVQETPAIEASVSGETRVNLEDGEVPFLFSMNNMERVAAATLTFEVSDKSLVKDGKLTGLNGFKLLDAVKWSEDGDKLTGTLTLSYLNGGSLTNAALTDIARLTFAATGESGKAAVKLTGVQVAGYDESGEAVFLDSTIAGGEAVTAIGSKYDVNTDGVVDLRDIVHAQKFYQLTANSANWEQAKHCDVTGDGMIDLEDLIAILRAYAA